jgi:peptidyl-prolyl cis-trans isomerase SurA
LLFLAGRVHLLETESFMSPRIPKLPFSQLALSLGLSIAVASSALPVFAQSAHSIPPPATAAPQSPFAGVVVEEPIVFVNDQIISKSDYERQLEEMEATGRQQNWTAQQLEDQKKNLLRDMVDQQLLLSKGKELGITGETDMVKQLDQIRKQNNLDSMEALEAAAKAQGVSFEDFKQHIRDRIITQQVIGQEVYRKVNISQSDIQRYYDQHKAELDQPESVKLSEILIPNDTTAGTDEAAQVAAAQTKADAVYAKLQAGAKFDELAKSTSAGTTAAEGGDLGEFKRGKLAKVFEDQTFNMKAGQFTKPIRTKQGFVIFEVTAHNPGGIPPLKDVLPQIEEAIGSERTEPALRAYLKQLREEAYLEYKPGYVDTAYVPNPSKPTYSAYTAPTPKKKKKVQRTRYRQRTFGSAPKKELASTPATAPASAPTPDAPAPNVPSLAQVPGAATAAASGNTAATGTGAAEPMTGQNATGQVGGGESQVSVANPATPNSSGTSSTATNSAATAATAKPKQTASAASQKPGKKEKIRYGQAPTKTLPSTVATQTVDAGANGSSSGADNARSGGGGETQLASNAAPGDIPGAGDVAAPPEKKSRFSDRARVEKVKKAKTPRVDPFAPPPISAGEVADRQTQSAPLGLAGDTSKAAKKPKPTEKTRLQDKAKTPAAADDATPPAGAPGSAPATEPAVPTPPAGTGTQPAAPPNQ